MIVLVKVAALTVVAAFVAQTANAPFTLTSHAFNYGGTIPHQQAYTQCGGRNTSPELEWKGAPAQTQTFALTVFDPDARNGQGWWHWVVFNIPSTVTKLQAGAGAGNGSLMPQAAVQGRNDFETVGYGGPCPPPGNPPHHYHFTLYAVDQHIDGLSPLSSGPTLVKAIRDHVLAKTELVGLYGR
jgi:Raf kinase inhibitor-like YbhB/YbcL family protein